ncbi:MAG: DUF1778 domain-containing protein [Halochromatium sp.]
MIDCKRASLRISIASLCRGVLSLQQLALRVLACALPLNKSWCCAAAAEVAHKSLTDFILDAACQAAEQSLLNQRLFMVLGRQYQGRAPFCLRSSWMIIHTDKGVR